jgi:hypothetical protein
MPVRRLEIVYPIRQYTEFPTFPLAVKGQLMFVKTYGWLAVLFFAYVGMYDWLYAQGTVEIISNILGSFVSWIVAYLSVGDVGEVTFALLWLIVTGNWNSSSTSGNKSSSLVYKKSRDLCVDNRSQTHMQNITENVNFTQGIIFTLWNMHDKV